MGDDLQHEINEDSFVITSKLMFQANEAEKANLALFLSLGGINVSLVNSLQEEVAFMTVSSAPAMWDVEVKHKWKSLNMELASWLEEKWRNNVANVFLQDFMEVRMDAAWLEAGWCFRYKFSYREAYNKNE